MTVEFFLMPYLRYPHLRKTKWGNPVCHHCKKTSQGWTEDHKYCAFCGTDLKTNRSGYLKYGLQAGEPMIGVEVTGRASEYYKAGLLFYASLPIGADDSELLSLEQPCTHYPDVYKTNYCDLWIPDPDRSSSTQFIGLFPRYKSVVDEPTTSVGRIDLTAAHGRVTEFTGYFSSYIATLNDIYKLTVEESSNVVRYGLIRWPVAKSA